MGAAAAGVADAAAAPAAPIFVINLCASMAPIASPGKVLAGLEAFRLYQVARAEDGRTRHRLRLGFFMSEAHAESVLASVRQQYPTAFTTCICDEDRRFLRGYFPDNRMAAAAPAAPLAAPRPAPQVAPPATPATDPSASSRVRALQVVATNAPQRSPM